MEAAIVRLVGVYDSNGSLRGEVLSWLGRQLGLTRCALSEITHGWTSERTEWKAFVGGLGVPFATYRRDDQPREVRIVTEGESPAVVAELQDGMFVPLLGRAELEACAGSADTLHGQIELAARRRRLAWPR